MDNTLITSYLDAFIPIYMQYRGCKIKEATKSNIAAKAAFGKDIALSDINLQTILYAVQHSTTYSYTILFSLWLTKRGLIQDEETNRLLNAFGPFFMREVIEKKASSVTREKFEFILRHDYPNEAVDPSDPAFLTQDWQLIFFKNVYPQEYVDNEMYQLCHDFIYDYKFYKEGKLSYKRKELKGYIELVKEFSHIKVADLNYQTMFQAYEHVSKRGVAFISFMMFCKEHGVLYDRVVDQIIDHCGQVISQQPKEGTLYKIFKSEHPEWYYMLPNNYNGKSYFDCLYLESPSDEIREAMKTYWVTTNYRNRGMLRYVAFFTTSLQGMKVNGIHDLTLETFKTQLHYFLHLEDEELMDLAVRGLIEFYYYVFHSYNHNPFEGTGISPEVLHKNNMLRTLLDGYEFVVYNPLDPVPAFDKWILCYAEQNMKPVDMNTTSSLNVDFSIYKNEFYKQLAKNYMWQQNVNSTSLKSRRTIVTCYAAPILNELTDFKHLANESEIKNLCIYKKDMQHIKLFVMNKWPGNPENAMIGFHMVVTDEYIAPGARYLLSSNKPHTQNTSRPLQANEMDRLLKIMLQHKEDSVFSHMALIYTVLLLTTENRSFDLSALEIDCLTEGSKPGIYNLREKVKTSANEYISIPVSSKTAVICYP